MDGGGQDELKRSRDGATPASPPSHRMGTDEGDDPPHLRRQQGCRYQPGVEVFCPRLPEEAFQRVEPGVVEPVQGAGGEAFEHEFLTSRDGNCAVGIELLSAHKRGSHCWETDIQEHFPPESLITLDRIR